MYAMVFRVKRLKIDRVQLFYSLTQKTWYNFLVFLPSSSKQHILTIFLNSVFGGDRVVRLFSFLCFVFFVLFIFVPCLVSPMLPAVSLDCPFLVVSLLTMMVFKLRDKPPPNPPLHSSFYFSVLCCVLFCLSSSYVLC